SGLAELLASRDFRSIEELQPSRHRMDLQLKPGTDEATMLASFAATTRNLIRQAERKGLQVVVLDCCSDSIVEGPFRAAPPETLADPRPALRTCYSMLAATARRIGFALAPEEAFVDWSTRSLRAGQTVYLQVEDGD